MLDWPSHRFSHSPFRRFVFLHCSSHFPLSPIRPFARSFWFKLLQRALHFRFGVDEKIRARDNTLAFPQAAPHFVVVSVFRAELNYARFEFSSPFVDEHNVARAG